MPGRAPVRALPIKVAQVHQRALRSLQELCIELTGNIDRAAARLASADGAQLTIEQRKQRETCKYSQLHIRLDLIRHAVRPVLFNVVRLMGQAPVLCRACPTAEDGHVQAQRGSHFMPGRQGAYPLAPNRSQHRCHRCPAGSSRAGLRHGRALPAQRSAPLLHAI